MKFNTMVQNVRLNYNFTKYFAETYDFPRCNIKVETAMILQFIKYLKWDSIKSTKLFSIGVLSNHPAIVNNFRNLKLMNFDNKDITVKVFRTVNDILYTHILFIPFKKSHKIISAAKILKNTPTLLISEKENMLKYGSDINIIVRNNKHRFELNKQTITNKNIKIKPEMIKLAYKV